MTRRIGGFFFEPCESDLLNMTRRCRRVFLPCVAVRDDRRNRNRVVTVVVVMVVVVFFDCPMRETDR